MRVLMWPTAAALRRKRAPPARPRSTRRRECAASGSQLVVSLAVEDGDLRPAPRRRAAQRKVRNCARRSGPMPAKADHRPPIVRVRKLWLEASELAALGPSPS
jgi:hypothetical protein